MGRAHGETLPHFRRIFYPIFTAYGVKEKGSAIKPSLFNILELVISEEMARVTRLEPFHNTLFLMHFIFCFSILVDNLATF